MRKYIWIFLFSVLLSGCATYKFHHGQVPYDKGYVVSRDDYTIPEYTVGQDNTVPPRQLAKERFNRRRKIVEDYYKRMGYIENHFKMAFWDPTLMFVKLVGGIFRLPFIAVSDYRYEHDPQYRERIKNMEKEKDLREEQRITDLKAKLTAYIEQDLRAEQGGLSAKSFKRIPPAQDTKPVKTHALPKPVSEVSAESKEAPQVTPQLPIIKAESVQESVVLQPPGQEPLPAVKEAMPAVTATVKTEAQVITGTTKEKPTVGPKQKRRAPEKPKAKKSAKIKPEKIKAESDSSEGIKAIIVAQPKKGFSPLRVQFRADKSSSKKSRIVSYEWDFGDGDSSTKTNPVNTYYSIISEPKYFTVKLTVKDTQGRSAEAQVNIEVLNK